MLYITDDVRIKELRPLLSPGLIMEELPITEVGSTVVAASRAAASDIIHGKDDRLIVVVGPCSIHDPKAALEYAGLLKEQYDKYQDDLLIIMRIYFEKPRTIVGWKGLINDPSLDGCFDINKGLRVGRQLLLDIANIGLPAGSEFLDSIIPQYISDLISWGAIGARTTESQVHRELASGLSMPIGFKNGTNGNKQIAVDAIRAAHYPHHFLSITKYGAAAIVSTKGNADCHVILRGSNNEPNYDEQHVQETMDLLKQAQLLQGVMIDCSHGNSNKDYRRQPVVAAAVAEQLVAGQRAICGVMLESNLVAGKQAYDKNKPLVYGQSITDACIAWEQTETVLAQLAQAVKQRREK